MQIDQRVPDQVGLADEQRVERHEQEHRLPGGEEDRDGEQAQQHLAVLVGEALARCGVVSIGYTVISSLSSFQISSFSSLNSGVTRIS